MANITRKNQKIFAENAINNGQFGSLKDTTKVLSQDLDVLQANAAYPLGWNSATLTSEELPSVEEFQSLNYINTSQTAYLLNKGIPEWVIDAEYYIGDIQREVAGTKIYRSITNNNIGNILTDVVNWAVYYDPDNSIFDNVTINNKLNTQPNTATISSGAITYTGAYMVVDTEGAAATDDLDTINGGSDGDIVIIHQTNSLRDITIKNNIGNIVVSTETDISFSDVGDSVTLQYSLIAGVWLEISRSINNDFLSSKATNGYQYLPSGLIMQWGLQNESIVGTFPITFPNTCLSLVATFNLNSSLSDSSVTTCFIISSSQFRVRVGSSNSDTLYWIAIGY